MKPNFLKSHPLLQGTIILTIAGGLSRIMGFYYRIFLSRTIGAWGLGIYQLIFPVLGLCLALGVSGIQTGISKFVAESLSKHHRNCKKYFYIGLFYSLILTFTLAFLLYRNSHWISIVFVQEQACEPLLKIIACSLPFAAVHSCINGYYYGLSQSSVPAFSQLIEQLARVFGAYIIYRIYTQQHRSISPSIAAWSVVIGEIAATVFSITMLLSEKKSTYNHTKNGTKSRLHHAMFLKYFLPLSANRVLLHFLSSAEAILIPLQLQAFGYSKTESLECFGVLTGMAMPVLLLPNVLTSSLSVLLLPAISTAQATSDFKTVYNKTKKTIEYSIILGLFSTLILLLSGKWVGEILFRNALAGTLLLTMSWICPFLNLSATLSSILHGLGKTLTAFFIQLTGCLIRITAIVTGVPHIGIKAYLYGLLTSHIVISGLFFLIIVGLLRNQTTPPAAADNSSDTLHEKSS